MAELLDWRSKLKAEEDSFASKQGTARLIKEEVDEEDIAEVVSRWTHIPVSKLLEGEVQKLLQLEEELHRARHRPGRGGDGRRRGGGSRPLRAERSESADRLVHLPGPDRRRQNRAWPGRWPSSSSTTSGP